MDSKPWSRGTTALAAAVLLLVNLWVRLPGLGDFVTPDELRLWRELVGRFLLALLNRDWAGTATSGYPGVIPTWLGSLGATLYRLQRPTAETGSLADVATLLIADPRRLDLLPWLRLPVAVSCTLGMVVFYWLARRLLGPTVALLAAALLTFDPFLLAHTRLINTDGLLAIFVAVAWLALMVATRSGWRRFYAASGVAVALAVLTKSLALAMGPPMLAWLVWQRWRGRRPVAGVLSDLLWVGVPGLAVSLLLWPALWVAPRPALARIWGLLSTYGETGHELGNFWLGKAVADPGPLFYPLVLLWRSTPAVLIGLILALWLLPSAGRNRVERGAVAGLLALVVWLGLILSVSPKKFDRYLLPAFPLLALAAAWGWCRLAHRPAQRTATHRDVNRQRRPGMVAAVGGILLMVSQAGLTLGHRPSYLTAYNPLLDGLRTAQQVMLVGWGEGLEEAARFLNRQTGSQARVAAWYGHNVFGPFYRGTSYDLYYEARTAADLYARDVDYVVTYINQMQRQLLDPGVQERLGLPLYTAARQGVALAQVYAWPKPFAHTGEKALAPGLQLLGWAVGDYDPAVRRTLPVQLFWEAGQAIAAGDRLPPVVVWIKDADGEVWQVVESSVSMDGVPVDGWLQRPVWPHAIDMPLPVGLVPGRYRVEMAPQAHPGMSLDEVHIDATPLAAVTDLQAAEPTAAFTARSVLFDGQVRFVGYSWGGADAGSGAETVLDLLWTALQPQAEPLQLFVHLVDRDDRIVVQYDGPLARRPGEATPSWRQGDLVRRRVRLVLPDDLAPAVYSVYIGLYRLPGGERLPLHVDGTLIGDSRYKVSSFEHSRRQKSTPLP